MISPVPFVRQITIALSLGMGWVPLALAAPWSSEQNDAVVKARSGDPAGSLPVLERLHDAHPDDVGLASDLTVVLTWAGRDSDAIAVFVTLPAGTAPDYVIDPVALAYRHLGDPTDALLLYRQGLQRSPGNAAFAAGAVRSLVDLVQIAPAIAEAEANLHAYGERVDILLAAGYAEIALGTPVEALRYDDRAIRVAPDNREAQHDRILVIDTMGAPQVALDLIEANPNVVSDAERRHVEGDAAAALVRWGALEPPSENLRFAATDRAIAALDALILRWGHEGDAARPDIQRARFDRMVAYRDRVRMADVLAEYRDLSGQGAVLPPWSIEAAADAYLYFHEPELARDLYQHDLDINPKNPEARLGLFYTSIDLDDYDLAYPEVDSAEADQPVWRYLKGLNEPIENPERATAELVAAEARLYGGELEEANRRLGAMAQAAPNNTRYLSSLADVYDARGWPRLAGSEYQISRALKPLNVSTEIGQTRTDLTLRDYPKTESELAGLDLRFPENLEVQRFDRIWQVHNMAEFTLTVEPALRSTNAALGGPGISVEAMLYSPPIDYNWRVLGGYYVANQELAAAEGKINLRQTVLGGEYREGDIVATLEATINSYGPSLGDVLGSNPGDGRVGFRASATWSIDDYWQLGGGAELFARDTPLRALAHGIRANAATTDLIYRPSELQEFSLAAEVMDFSDGNTRSSLTGQYTQRLWTAPKLVIDGIGTLSESQNSGDNNRPYFNPHIDAGATIGVSIEQPIYRRYTLIYDHHLVLTTGAYWEDRFGSGDVDSVLYEHRLRSNDTLEAGIGVTLSHQPYDGVYENAATFLLNLKLFF